jgi:hypothetical protein
MKETDVCYIVSHGFASRMVFQTGLLTHLSGKGKKAALIAPDKEDPNLVDYCEKQGVDLYEFRAPKNLFTIDYLFKRKYFLEEIKSNPSLWAKHLWHTRGNKSLNPYLRLRAYYYYWIYRLIKVFPGIRRRFLRYENRLLDSDAAITLLREINPKVVVATYPINLPEAMTLRAAQKMGIKTVIHLLSWDNITCKGYFPALADYYIAWGPIMKSEFMQYYQIPEDRIYACGVPHFDEHIRMKADPRHEDFVRELGLNPEAPYLFVAMSSPYFCPTAIEIIEWLAEKVEQGIFGQDTQLIVRPHPQNVSGGMADFSWLPRLEAIKGKKVAVDYPSVVESKLPWSMQDHDMRRLSRLLAGCACCIQFGSTVAIDALMVDKPVITIAFDAIDGLPWYKSGRRQIDFFHFAKLIENGGSRVAASFDELAGHIQDYILDPEADQERRQHALYQECGLNDGRATERVADALSDILDRPLPTPSNN